MFWYQMPKSHNLITCVCADLLNGHVHVELTYRLKLRSEEFLFTLLDTSILSIHE